MQKASKKGAAYTDVAVQAFASTSDMQTTPRHGGGARPPQGSSRGTAATSSRIGAPAAEASSSRAARRQRHLPAGTLWSIRKGQTQKGPAGVRLRTTNTGSMHRRPPVGATPVRRERGEMLEENLRGKKCPPPPSSRLDGLPPASSDGGAALGRKGQACWGVAAALPELL